MEILKGILHVHSNYSYDGQHSLEEIARYGKERGYAFLGMSEHSDTLDEARMEKYIEECQRLSTQECLIIPGIEFTCDNNLHLIGLGLKKYTNQSDPLKVTDFIHKYGGIAIIAHPIRYNYNIPSGLAQAVDGIEVWNASYDGRFIPNDRSLKLIKEIKKKNKSIIAFGGQDLHQIRNNCCVEISILCKELSQGAILFAIKKGESSITNGYFNLDSNPDSGLLRFMLIYIARKIYLLAKMIRNRILSIQ